MVRVNVNRRIVVANQKSGSREPPFSIMRSGKRVERAHAVKLVGDAVLVYRPDKPLKCGARVWIEADDAVAV